MEQNILETEIINTDPVIIKRPKGRPKKVVVVDPNFVKRPRGKPLNSKNKDGYKKQYEWEVTYKGVTTTYKTIPEIAIYLNMSVQKVNKIVYNLLKRKNYHVLITKKYIV